MWWSEGSAKWTKSGVAAMSVISQREAMDQGIAWVRENETRQADYWTLAEIARIEYRDELNSLEQQLNDLCMPGWRFLFILDDSGNEAEIKEVERRHFEKNGAKIEKLRNRIEELRWLCG